MLKLRESEVPSPDEDGLSLVETVVAAALLSLVILSSLKAEHWVLRTLGALRIRNDAEVQRVVLTSPNCSRKIVADLTVTLCRTSSGENLIQLEEN